MTGNPNYVFENLGEGLNRVWEIYQTLHQEQTPYQNVLIAKTAHGITLFCDNERQSTELTQLIYHEAQIVPALLIAKEHKRVLVLGSSEGVVTQICRQAGVGFIYHVDVDEACLRACARHLTYGYTPNDVETHLKAEKNVQLLFQDGHDFAKEFLHKTERFDIIVLDLPDENLNEHEQHNRLYSPEFTAQLANLLTPDGCLISQAGCPSLWRNKILIRAWHKFHDIFNTVVHFETEEQNWTWLIGTRQNIENIESHMLQALQHLPYRPRYIDAKSIRKSLIEPMTLRISQTSKHKKKPYSGGNCI